jgi:hypothetical protein
MDLFSEDGIAFVTSKLFPSYYTVWELPHPILPLAVKILPE